ncbi:MAG: tetratricopeptide repeat protein [Bacteroidetes bacterium]|nr:MAG: tetratricopeptide repeat protein [Bacteroidota bacterium]
MNNKKLLVFALLFSVATSLFAQKDPYKRAKNHLKERQYVEAVVAIDEAISDEKLKEKDDTWLMRGYIYDSLSFIPNGDSLVSDPLTTALQSYNKVIGMKKGSASDANKQLDIMYAKFMNKGVAAYQASDMSTATRFFERSALVKPSDTVALSYALTTAGAADKIDSKKVEGFCDRLIALNYTQPMVYLWKIRLASDEENFEKAIKVVADARKVHPTNKDILLSSINVFARANKLPEAIKDLEEAVKLDPTNPILYVNLGLLYEQTGSTDKALPNYSKALELQPNNYDAIYSVGAFHYNQGVKVKKIVDGMTLQEYEKKGKEVEEQTKVHFKAALPYFEKAANLKKDDMQVLGGLKSMYMILGEPDKAAKIQELLDKL